MSDPLRTAARLAEEWLASLPERRVFPSGDVSGLDRPLPDEGVDPSAVLEDLARDADGGLVAQPGPRYFGFVTGGSLPAALGADWLASAWDQNSALHVMSPAAATIEEVAGRWCLELLGLPPGASVGFTTGATMANATCLAAARHAVLARAGWDVERDGLIGAPPLAVFGGAEIHASALSALRLVGLGAGTVRVVDADGQGAMQADALAEALAETDGPAIVCAQAGNVNTGAIDPLDDIAAACAERGAWLHVDGAFGLWAAAAPSLRHLVRGAERADSWAVDGHKWLNVPYDSGLAIVADAAVHRAAMGVEAAYLVSGGAAERDGFMYVPEASRRPRGIPVYAALRALGRRGVADLVERCCAHARALAARLDEHPEVTILNDVVLNQALARFGDDDERTRAVVARVQADGTCWLGGTVWHDMAAMRISVSNWSTTANDVERSAAAILEALDA